MKTDTIRNEIDHIDSRIIQLLAKREELENRDAKTCSKKQTSRTSEQTMYKIKHKAARKGIDPSVVERVCRGVIDETSGGEDERYFPDI